MALTLSESQAVNNLSKFLYDFLPGNPHPYANQDISFQGAAGSMGLGAFWSGGSKQPAITNLLTLTLERKRDKFCPLMTAIVLRAITYRTGKNDTVTREAVERLNDLITRVGFKIPELWDPDFRQSLPSETKAGQPATDNATPDLQPMRDELLRLGSLKPQERGYAFEAFLRLLFRTFRLDPRSSFRLVGEQIDGSFQLDAETYLVEAKWQAEPTPLSDLLVFHGKVEAMAQWTRGLFVSYSGFTPDGLEAFARGRSTRLIGMNGQDLHFVLEGKLSMDQALRLKARAAAETSRFFVSVYELSAKAR